MFHNFDHLGGFKQFHDCNHIRWLRLLNEIGESHLVEHSSQNRMPLSSLRSEMLNFYNYIHMYLYLRRYSHRFGRRITILLAFPK